MQSNVIDFTSYSQARNEAAPTWSGMSHATELEIMTRGIGKPLLEIIIEKEEVRDYAISNIGDMNEDTYNSMLSAHQKISEAVSLLMQAQNELDQASKNETRGGDNCLAFEEIELPDFHDFPA
jgi:hypothetical protein